MASWVLLSPSYSHALTPLFPLRRPCPCVGSDCPCLLAAALQGAATRAAGVATLVGGSPLQVPCSWPPLRASRYKRLCPRVPAAPTGWPQPVVHAGGASSRKRHPFRAGPGRSLPSPCRGPWLWHGRG
ncbi:hypothetical protein B296_00025816 [Ensete ventricosum]|uniref:Uncharacterized protein n=1 Tax=Ensete ventricosum TaxID=4639 RepID=A0A426ZGP8_ENSVE|nr:hypothetical protein B296_00025816 [Ensete ventricosum]